MTDQDVTLHVPPADAGRCAALLLETLQGHRGVLGVEFVPVEGSIRVRYDPEVIDGTSVQDVVRSLGMKLENELVHCNWALQGARCRDCALALERYLGKIPGVRFVRANPAAGALGVELESGRGAEHEIVRRVRAFGYRAEPRTAEAEDTWFRHPMVIGAVVCGVLCFTGILARNLGTARPLWIALFAAAYVAGGWQGLLEAWASLRNRIFDVNFLMLMSAIGAAAIGYWQEGALLLFLFSLSNALQYFALERTRKAIRALMQLKPETATLVVGGQERVVPAAEIQAGDLVRVRPGERLAADGTVAEGETHVDESAMTGESIPVVKRVGSQVFAGTINGTGSIEFTVTRLPHETRLARIIELVEKAQDEKAPTQQFIDRFGQYYAFAVVAAVALTIVLLPTFFHWTFEKSFYRAMVALVVASPCALVISTPATILAGIAGAARHGILFKGGGHLETMGQVKAVALDKTGTLTIGRPVLTDCVPAPGRTVEELRRYAAAAERRSEHPVAEAIVKGCAGIALPDATSVNAITGRGIEAMVEGRRVLVGSLRLMEERGIEFPAETLERLSKLEAEGRTVVLAADDRPLGLLAVADEPRPEAADVVRRLKASGVKRVVMLTGDHREAAEAIGRRLGVDEVLSGLLPEEKVFAIRDLKKRFGVVAMVGDGVNDAPALATADVGIAMGGRGTDVALETADVALMADSLSKLPDLVILGRRARSMIRQNVFISVGMMAALVTLNFFGKVQLPYGVVGHEGSTVVVVLNGLRLLGGWGKKAS